MNEAEQANLAMFLSLSGVGLSLINGLQEEVAYMSLTCAPALWEIEVKNKWKHLNMELASWLEEKWRNDVRMVYLEDFMEVGYHSNLCGNSCSHNNHFEVITMATITWKIIAIATNVPIVTIAAIL